MDCSRLRCLLVASKSAARGSSVTRGSLGSALSLTSLAYTPLSSVPILATTGAERRLIACSPGVENLSAGIRDFVESGLSCHVDRITNRSAAFFDEGVEEFAHGGPLYETLEDGNRSRAFGSGCPRSMVVVDGNSRVFSGSIGGGF